MTRPDVLLVRLLASTVRPSKRFAQGQSSLLSPSDQNRASEEETISPERTYPVTKSFPLELVYDTANLYSNPNRHSFRKLLARCCTSRNLLRHEHSHQQTPRTSCFTTRRWSPDWTSYSFSTAVGFHTCIYKQDQTHDHALPARPDPLTQ